MNEAQRERNAIFSCACVVSNISKLWFPGWDFLKPQFHFVRISLGESR